jgi:hypothetical protein
MGICEEINKVNTRGGIYSLCHSIWMALHLTYTTGVGFAIGMDRFAIDLHHRGRLGSIQQHIHNE